jgi:predicted glycosyltransferase
VKLERTFPDAGRLQDKLRYTGYVVEQAVQTGAGDRRQGEVLISAGGGAVGAPLFDAAIAARALSRHRDRPWRLITGRNLPAELATRIGAAAAAAGIIVEQFRADFPRLLQDCLLSVSQGGYNTVMELIAAGCPAVIVPFAEGSESEQGLRGQLLADRGILQLVEPEALTPARLASAIDQAAAPAALQLDLDGAAGTARLLLETVRP